MRPPATINRDVRDSAEWTNPDGSRRMVDYIGMHPSRDYDLMFFRNGKTGPVAFCYCDQHLAVHRTGWCTVGPRNKIPLQATEYMAAYAEAKAMGCKFFEEK